MTEQAVADSVLSAKGPESPAEQRRARLRAQAKLPRPAARRGSPERQLAEMLAIRDNPIIRHWDRSYRTELRKAGQKKPSETLVQLAVRQHVMVEWIDTNVLKEPGGPVHRRKRQLHAYIQQRTDLVAGLMQLRLKLGLEQLTEEESQPGGDMAAQLAAARARRAELEREREAQREADVQHRIAEALRAAGVAPAVEPVALLEGPSPTVPEPSPEPEAPVLELAPEPEPPPPQVIDCGNPRATAPFVREILQDEPRFQPLRSARIPGTRLYTDDSGYVLPNPFDR